MPESSMFGAYRLEEKLGEGGMGVVYRAVDTELDRIVAIKTILASAIGDGEVLERFVREAKAASRLQHPSIVTIYHVGQHVDTRYIVMEYVDGMSLKRAIGGRPMSVNQLCAIAIQVADALAMAHERHVVHRDMKAENVMLTSRMQAKILDFGLAKVQQPDKDVTALTQVGVAMGTVSHMSPEQALGLEVDGRSDVFSFGVMLYEMASGQMPFDGPSAAATMARVLNQEPTQVGEINRELPPELQTLIHDCLRKDRNFRPTSGEVLSRLKKIEASLSANRIASPDLRGGDMPTTANPVASGAAAAFPTGPVSSSRHRVAKVEIPSTFSTARVPAVAKPSGSTAAIIKSGRTALPQLQADPKKLGQLRVLFSTMRAFRIALGVALLAVPLAYLSYFVIMGGLIKMELVQGTAFLTVVQSLVSPVNGFAGRVLSFNTKSVGTNGEVWDFVALAMVVITFILRHIILLWVQKIETSIKTQVVQLETASAAIGGVIAHDRGSSHRLGMLREYAEAKKILSQEKRHLAFLSIDVVGSTKMKSGEDKLSIEHAFSEYKKFVERILKQNNLWKVAWTPDGIMCAFNTSSEATKAAQGVLNGLAWFNDGVHHLRTPFSVRCGVNAGEVVFPQDKDMEEVSDETIDIAGHMQKYAAPGAIWLSTTVLKELAEQDGFQPVTDKVDGNDVVEWRPSKVPSGAQASASTS